MQSSDGGWAAFDVDNNWQLLNKVPFADHNAMLDPTCPGHYGRVIDALLKMRIAAGTRGDSKRRSLSAAHSGTRRKLVWQMGRQLYLWNVSGSARAGGGGSL